MTYEIKKVDERGCGYAVVTLENGDTFGQWFRVSDTTDEAKFFVEVEEQLATAKERIAPRVPAVIDPKILEQVGVARQLPSRSIEVISRG